MKYIKISLLAVVLLGVLASCKSVATSTKDIKYMPIRFKPLTRADVSLIGNLYAETTVTGKLSKNGKTLDTKYSADYKKGLISKSETTEILYFAPGPGEAMTGSLYENDIFNTVFTPAGITSGKRLGFFNMLKAKLKGKVTTNDPAIDFAYYTLIEKYPDIDYFINVRFDRKVVLKGKKYTETVLVKADGLKLKTDPIKPDGSRN